ncbi:amino acid ABC transporter substrate-binding protein [Peptococcaceae bacterium 1198_IL3148]
MSRTKYLVLTLLVIGLALFAVGCGGGEKPATNEQAATEKTTWEQIQEKGVMVVGLDDTFRPMGFRDENNELVGFDIDMGKELEKRLGIKIEWMPTEWEGVTGSLNAKKFDAIINGMSITEDRKKAIAFSIPYVNASIGMAVTKDNEEIKTAADLEGKVIATQSGSSGYEACKKLVEDGILAEENVKMYAQYPEAFQDLEIGRVEAIVVDVTTAEDYVSKKPDNYKIVEEPLVADLYAIGLRKDDTDLKEVLDNTLREMMADGTLAEISKKWFDGKDMIAQPE